MGCSSVGIGISVSIGVSVWLVVVEVLYGLVIGFGLLLRDLNEVVIGCREVDSVS